MTTLFPGVRRIVAANAGLMTGTGTNTYLLGSAVVAVVDPGPKDPQHLRAILAAAPAAIRWIIVTHTHRDHSPLAAELAERTGASLVGLPPPGDGRQDEDFRPTHQPADGETIAVDGLRLTAIHTPGHASNCVCYLAAGDGLGAEGLLLTGDHVLEGVAPVILAPDGDMSAYLSSLEKLEAYAFDRIAPGHGWILSQGKAMLGVLRAHRLARESKVLRRLEQAGAANLASLTTLVYDDVPVERHPWAQLTLEAHLIKLAREARVSVRDGVWRPAAA